MTGSDPPYPDIRTLDRIPWESSGQAMTLAIGPWRIGIRGLTPALEGLLARRWGGFSRPGFPDDPSLELLAAHCTAGAGLGLGSWSPGEVYRLEGAMVEGRQVIRSYNFCMAPVGDGPGTWKLVLGGADGEPLPRTVENAVRCLVSRLALLDGGFALHGAGVRKSGKTWIYAGESGAGKSTAVSLSSPCDGLGDDFAVTVPRDGGWATCAVPFDNSEQAPGEPVRGLIPLGAILRLFKAGPGEQPRVEVPAEAMKIASLLTCVMLPGLFSDLTDTVLENVHRFVMAERFGHLHFHKDRRFVDQALAFACR